MGAWGIEPWANDTASDWFRTSFVSVDFDAVIERAFGEPTDTEQIRAACYILQTLGRVYVWPGDLDKLGHLLSLGISSLQEMTTRDSDTFTELEAMWGSDSEVFDALNEQLSELKLRQSEGHW